MPKFPIYRGKERFSSLLSLLVSQGGVPSGSDMQRFGPPMSPFLGLFCLRGSNLSHPKEECTLRAESKPTLGKPEFFALVFEHAHDLSSNTVAMEIPVSCMQAACLRGHMF